MALHGGEGLSHKGGGLCRFTGVTLPRIAPWEPSGAIFPLTGVTPLVTWSGYAALPGRKVAGEPGFLTPSVGAAGGL